MQNRPMNEFSSFITDPTLNVGYNEAITRSNGCYSPLFVWNNDDDVDDDHHHHSCDSEHKIIIQNSQNNVE